MEKCKKFYNIQKKNENYKTKIGGLRLFDFQTYLL